jgi:hypothetical protein
MEKLCVDFEGKKRQMRLTINSHYDQKFILKIIFVSPTYKGLTNVCIREVQIIFYYS